MSYCTFTPEIYVLLCTNVFIAKQSTKRILFNQLLQYTQYRRNKHLTSGNRFRLV